MKTFLIALVLSVSSLASAQASEAPFQSCSLVDEFDDWRLGFDFEQLTVNFFDNDSEVTGTYHYTVEIFGGADVFQSDDDKDPWTATYYGDRNGSGNRAVLTIGEESYEFVCTKQ